MGLIYTAPFRNISLTANGSSSQDIWELVTPIGVAIKVHQIHLETANNTDERIDLALMLRSTTGSGGSSAITPVARNTRDTVASGITSFKTLVTTPGSAVSTLEAYQWSELAPLDIIPTPEMRLELSAAAIQRLVLNNANSFVGGTRICSGFVTWEEG